MDDRGNNVTPEARGNTVTTIRLVVAEDNLLVREGLLSLLSTADELEVLATCESLDELLLAVDEHGPDVVMTDIRMPPDHSDEGIRAALEVRRRHPEMGVLVLSQFVDPAYALALLEDGVSRRGYLLKDHVDDGDRLIDAIRSVAAGGSFIDDDVVDALVRGRSRTADNPLATLSDREMEVLAEIATGATNATIAEKLVLSANSIEKHSNSIFAKLGLAQNDNINRRVAAVLMFLSGQEISG
ncbi:MAG: response regulator transcription factor [Actinomycetota bacterium]